MTLREQLHQAVDELDDEMLASAYERLQALQRRVVSEDVRRRIPTREEILEMTASDTSSWSDELIAERHL